MLSETGGSELYFLGGFCISLSIAWSDLGLNVLRPVLIEDWWFYNTFQIDVQQLFSLDQCRYFPEHSRGLHT